MLHIAFIRFYSNITYFLKLPKKYKCPFTITLSVHIQSVSLQYSSPRCCVKKLSKEKIQNLKMLVPMGMAPMACLRCSWSSSLLTSLAATRLSFR